MEQHQQVPQTQEAQQGVHGGPAEVEAGGVGMQQQAEALEAALRGSQAVVQHSLLAAEEGMATLLARLRGPGQVGVTWMVKQWLRPSWGCLAMQALPGLQCGNVVSSFWLLGEFHG